METAPSHSIICASPELTNGMHCLLVHNAPTAERLLSKAQNIKKMLVHFYVKTEK